MLTAFWLSIAVVSAIPIGKFQAVFNGAEEKGHDEGNFRDLKVGELNFLHTTDTHGWLGSHLTQPNYGADWGDFISFTTKFKERRIGSNDLLLIDTGDKHDGNGISDATVPNGIRSTEIFNEQDYDLLTLGNHELYTEDNTILEYYSTVVNDKFKGKYVASNVEFVTNESEIVPFGSKYRFFQTANLRYNILAFSFLFNFQRANSRAIVTPAAEELQKDWFQEVVNSYPEEKVDVIIVFGHMPITDPEEHEINKVHAILRTYYPNSVIQYFGGHSHIRDFAIFDERSTGLQSGRFAETVGFLSIDNVRSEAPRFSRRYIDFNKDSFAHHSGVNFKKDLRTERGANVSSKIGEIREELNLTSVVGYVPRSYYMDSKPLTSKKNIYNLLTTNVLPLLKSKKTNSSKSRFILINTGSIRYDLYEGEFTKDTEYIVSPFSNDWNFVEIPLALAEDVAAYLNNGAILMTSMGPPESRMKAELPKRRDSCPFIHTPGFTKGYTTLDDFGCKGDDKVHNSELYFPVPNVVQSVELQAGWSESVHFVFYSFIQPYVINALNALNEEKKVVTYKFSDADCMKYGGKSTGELLKDYIRSLDKS